MIFVGVVALALLIGAVGAGAQTTAPGLLTAADLPAGFTQPSEARTFPSFTLATINPSS